MSAVTTNTVVAAVAKVAIFTTFALAVILLPCPTFVAWSLMLDSNFYSVNDVLEIAKKRIKEQIS